MDFERKQTIETSLSPKRALIIYGPRRVGKTTMLRKYLATQMHKRIRSVTGDELHMRELFSKQSLDALREFVGSYDIIAIDEAQQLPHVGMNAKMIVDAFPEKQLLLTGSSSFELAGEIGEPLTGRHFTLTLLPIAQCEMRVSTYELKHDLERLLIYGSYPEVLLAHDDVSREAILRELVSSYLYKDILALDKIKSTDLLRDIARMIALQIGNEVSLNEIAVALHTDVKTVGRYLDLLEKMFVIKRVRGFSRNLRNEISKKARYYFLDNGVRNAVIGQFSPLALRADTGALWENFVFTELLKRDGIAGISSSYYFWRTHTGSEIDIIREIGGYVDAYECKWSPHGKARVPATFAAAYPKAVFSVITPENYLETLLPLPTSVSSL
jgi:hypothetical protein